MTSDNELIEFIFDNLTCSAYSRGVSPVLLLKTLKKEAVD